MRIDTLAPAEDQDLDSRQRRGNRIWMAVLIVMVLGLMVSSYWLFNNYHDPALSADTISH